MSYQCPLCTLDSKNHSFHKIFERDEIAYFYSKPSEAKLYFDKTSILNHYEGMLNDVFSTNKKWVWIFDSNEFSVKHFLQIDVGIGLARLISSKFSKNLKKIIILNANIYIFAMNKIVTPFLDKETQTLIEFDTNNTNWKDVLENI